MLDVLAKWKTWWAAAIFALCVAPTFISYRPYLFRWDDSDYLWRSILVSQGVWTRNLHKIGAGMVSIRPPAMTLLGLPWGAVTSWDAASRCFITLGWMTALFAALCLYLLLRISVKPFYLIVASACVLVSVGPYPAAWVAPSSPTGPFSTHAPATAFLADALFTWITLAALLLIPYEARTYAPSVAGAITRGILWGVIFSSGAMTKASFFYFIVAIVPILLVIRFRHAGWRNASAALAALVVSSAPAVIYWLRWGRLAWENAKGSSFGATAALFHISFWHFVGSTLRNSPGLVPSLGLAVAGLTLAATKKRTVVRGSDFVAMLIMMGFGAVVLVSVNREIRFALPVIVATPFLVGLLLSGEGGATGGRPALLATAFVFCSLAVAALPMWHRADRKSLSRCDLVLAESARCGAQRILLATDSPTLNLNQMKLAIAASTSQPSLEADTLAYRALANLPLAEDFSTILESDEVVFQDKDVLSPPYTNQRVSEYEQYTRQLSRSGPIHVGEDVSVYPLRCR